MLRRSRDRRLSRHRSQTIFEVIAAITAMPEIAHSQERIGFPNQSQQLPSQRGKLSPRNGDVECNDPSQRLDAITDGMPDGPKVLGPTEQGRR